MTSHEKNCIPCRGGMAPLTPEEASALARNVPNWEVGDGASRLVREFQFDTYAQALTFVNAVSAVAEKEGHHPDIHFGWGYVTVTFYTHKINGLHENDFIMAAKVDSLLTNE